MELAQAPPAPEAAAATSERPPVLDGPPEASSPPIWSWVLVGLEFAVNFFFSGVIFGWGALQLLLEQDGIFADLCSAGSGGAESVDCASRASQFVLLYTIGSTSNVIGGLPSGFLVDALGPLRCALLSGAVVSSGLLLLAFAPSSGGIGLLGVGSALTGAGGSLVMVSSIPAAFVVPSERRPFVLSTINCLFDASSIVFLGLYQLYARAGISRKALFTGYSMLCVILHLSLAFAWSRGPGAQLRAAKREELRQRQELEKDGPARATPVVVSSQSANASEPQVEAHDRGGAAQSTAVPDLEKPEPKSGTAGTPSLHGLPLWRQLVTFEFFFAAVFLPLQLLRSNAYLGTNKHLLESLGDAGTGHTYLQVFTATLPASTVCVPLISRLMTRRGFGETFILIVLLGVLWNGIVLLPSLPMQVFSFAVYTNFRALLYSAYFVYIAHTFGSRTSGRAHGLVTILASVANFSIWPGMKLAARFGRDGLLALYTALLTLSAPTLVLCLVLRQRLRHAPWDDCRVAN